MTTTIIAIIIVAFALIYFQNSRKPKLGIENGKFKPLSSKPNSVSTQTEDPKKQVLPLSFKDSKSVTREAAINALESIPGLRIQEDRDDYIYAIATTPLMKYHDDVEIYLNEDDQQVHFRSASRAGYSDMGVNKKRYKSFSELYENA